MGVSVHKHDDDGDTEKFALLVACSDGKIRYFIAASGSITLLRETDTTHQSCFLSIQQVSTLNSYYTTPLDPVQIIRSTQKYFGDGQQTFDSAEVWSG